MCWAIQRFLEPHSFIVETVSNGREAIEHVRGGFQGVVILDLRLPDMSGNDVFSEIIRLAPATPVIFLTGFGTADLALSSIADGAFDFLDKGELQERLLELVDTAFEQLSEELSNIEPVDGGGELDFPEIVAVSREMQTLFRTLKNAIESNVTVLIQGESGTGKEIIARAIHSRGPRKATKFIALNCAGIPESLLEAELFGYERGAFTGATNRKPGLFEQANRGTLLLDEIGEMHPTLQAKLLRVVQLGEFQRLGGVETLHTDVRILSATHRNLESEIESGGFRQDLYYRLAVFTVHLPALRERQGDVAVLVDHFIEKSAKKEGRVISGVDTHAMSILESYSYPGNVRELENLISYAVVSSRGPTVTLSDFPKNFLRSVARERALPGANSVVSTAPSPGTVVPTPFPVGVVGDENNALVSVAAPPTPESFPVAPSAAATQHVPTLREVEERHIRQVLALCDGNKAKTARILEINRVTLYRKLSQMEPN